MDWKSGVPFPAGEDNSLLHIIQAGSRAHPSSYNMSNGGLLSRGIKRPRREGDHSLPSSAEVELYLHSPYVFMAQ
jgi:hypothetical protein